MRKTRKFACVLESLDPKLSLSSLGYTPAVAVVQAYDDPCDPAPPDPGPDPGPTEPITPNPCPGGPGGPIDPGALVD